jgi:hypothetical protein
VEVSGWDISQSFFVEKPELEWNEENGKQITLSRALRKRTMLFVRLLQSTAPERCSPVAYWAEHQIAASEATALEFVPAVFRRKSSQ